MNAAQYRKYVAGKVSPPKQAKAGIKAMMRTKKLLNIGHGIEGFAGEIGELMQGLHEYLTGASRLKEEMKGNAREELGDASFYLIGMLAKELKLKVPVTTKKVRLDGTLTANILLLGGLATDLLDLHKKRYYGLEYDLDKMRERAQLAVTYVYGICFSLFGEPLEGLLDENKAKLDARYEKAASAAEASNRNVAKEQAAATAVKKKGPIPPQFLKKVTEAKAAKAAKDPLAVAAATVANPVAAAAKKAISKKVSAVVSN